MSLFEIYGLRVTILSKGVEFTFLVTIDPFNNRTIYPPHLITAFTNVPGTGIFSASSR